LAVCFQKSWCASEMRKTWVAKTSKWLYRYGFVNKVYGNFQSVFSFGINVGAVWRASERLDLCDVVKHTPFLTPWHSSVLCTHTHSCCRFLTEFCLCFCYVRISFIKCEVNSLSEIYHRPLKVISAQPACFNEPQIVAFTFPLHLFNTLSTCSFKFLWQEATVIFRCYAGAVWDYTVLYKSFVKVSRIHIWMGSIRKMIQSISVSLSVCDLFLW